ncbi:MAG: bifunctional phosphopantothenoylcysteine decarboxylase/phosphopantothenate--cysteine ligase CoaBC [Candidatus Heimdallarchaeota archaeon]|nr:MAG: bifunctional phosphopantothenoylcysteine decarboxylase/phosphopantothenate--cysteine ligase CoaBC [Candidatus Heimdallarchaeota archaeon]
MGIFEILGSKGNELRNKRVLIGVTGSIAAIEVPHLVREILRHEGDPIVVLSEEATRLIATDALAWCMDKEPITQISGMSEHVKWISHPDYKIDLCMICPATANTISKLANGIADGPVTLAALAAFGAKIPLLIVPAAHTVLLDNPILERNISYLQDQNVHFLASTEIEGKFKFPPLNQLMQNIFKLINPSRKLKEKRFLITGGATREYLDDVRFLSNPSTGLSALLVANALMNHGAEILLILGEGHTLDIERIPVPVKIVRSTKDMYDDVQKELSNFEYHGLIAVAAVSDYRPHYQTGKIPSKQQDLTLDLVPTVKIVEKIRENFPNLYLIAYKAEVSITEEELLKRGKEFQEKHKLDMVCANWVGEPKKGFVSETNDIFVIRSGTPHIHLKGSKMMIGERIAEIIAEEFSNRSTDQ